MALARSLVSWKARLGGPRVVARPLGFGNILQVPRALGHGLHPALVLVIQRLIALRSSLLVLVLRQSGDIRFY